jgi:hypothetical protein
LVATRAPLVSYAQNSGSAVFVAGDGFAADTRVSFAGTPAANVTVLSPAFLVAQAPAGSKATSVTVTTPAGSASGTVPPTNVALGKPATQSSDYSSNYPARNAVDGSLTNFADTQDSTQPWWQVDTGQSYPIDQIAIYNRSDCCADRLADYYVFVSDEPFASTSPADTLAQPGVWSQHETTQAGRPTVIDVGRSGRYVRVQLAGSNQLALDEVQVFVQP